MGLGDRLLGLLLGLGDCLYQRERERLELLELKINEKRK
jgi:hypothetical protein